MKKVAIVAVALFFVAAFVNAQASVSYSVAMSGTGWSGFVSEGDTGGTSGARRQAQAIRVRLNSELPGTIKYQVNINGRWSDWKYHNEIAGEVGSQGIQSIRVELTGELDDKYDVQYTVFQGGNWTPWMANGADGGAVGQNRFVEAIQIILTENRAGRRQGTKGRTPPPPPAPPGQGRGGRR